MSAYMVAILLHALLASISFGMRPNLDDDIDIVNDEDGNDTGDSVWQISECFKIVHNDQSGGERAIDKTLAVNVEIKTLPPASTGFPEWFRTEEGNDTAQIRGDADYVVPAGATDTTARILYLHGGGYEFYSPHDIYRPVTTRLAHASGMPVLVVDYRLSPEYRHPAQVEDGIQALQWLAENGPNGASKATKLFLAGDSAGGGLAIALGIYFRDHPIPGVTIAGIAAVSPWTDLACRGESYETRRWRPNSPHADPIWTSANPAADTMRSVYRLLGKPGEPGATDPKDPSISPLYANLDGLPPTQIHVGDADVMLSYSVDFTKKANNAGSPVTLHIWSGMWHCFTQYSEGCGTKKPCAPQ